MILLRAEKQAHDSRPLIGTKREIDNILSSTFLMATTRGKIMDCKACEKEKFIRENPKVAINLLAHVHTCDVVLNKKDIINILNKWEESKCRGFHEIWESKDIHETLIPEFVDDLLKNQPERSKREEFPYRLGQVKFINGNRTWWEDNEGNMRCSEHCGNTVSEVQ